jgi:drug/metabolite transporter (DMT)-like permease
MTSASRAVLFIYTAPFFTALGGHLFLPAERLRAAQAVGLLLAFAGVTVAFADGLLHSAGSLAGDLLCLGAGALWGAANVVVKGSKALRRVDNGWLLVIQLGGSVPFLLAGAALFGELGKFPQATAVAWLGLGYQTVVVAFASYLAWYWLLLTHPAAKVSGFTFLTPLFGVVFGGLVLGEPISAAIVAGLVAIAVGLRLVNRSAPA